MTDDFDAETSRALVRLVHGVELGAASREFTLYFVECGLQSQQDQYIARVADEAARYGVEVLRIDLRDRIVQDLVQVFEENLTRVPSAMPGNVAIAVVGLESSILLDPDRKHPAVLQVLNLAREKFARTLPYTFTCWLSYDMLRVVQLGAPDFWSWRSGEPERLPVSPRLISAEASDAVASSTIESWSDAVAHVGRLEYLLAANSDTQLDAETRVMLLAVLGDAYRFLTRYQQARRVYQEALNLAGVQFAIAEWRGRLLNKLGIVLREIGETQQALEFFREYVEAGQTDEQGRATALNNLGLVYLDRGELSSAFGALEQAVHIAEDSGAIGDATVRQESLSNALGSLGLAYIRRYEATRDVEDLARATDVLQRSLTISQELNDQRAHIRDLLNLAVAESIRGELAVAESRDAELGQAAAERFARAVESLARAVEISAAIGDLMEARRTRVQLADFLTRVQRLEADRQQLLSQTTVALDPVQWYEEALGKAGDMRDEQGALDILLMLARYSQERSIESDVVSRYKAALQKAQDLDGTDEQQLECVAALIRVYDRGQPDEVAQLKSRAATLLQRLGRPSKLTVTATLCDTEGWVPLLAHGVRVGDPYILCIFEGEPSASVAAPAWLAVARSEVMAGLAEAALAHANAGTTAIGIAKFADFRARAAPRRPEPPAPASGQAVGGAASSGPASASASTPPVSESVAGQAADSLRASLVSPASLPEVTSSVDVHVRGFGCEIKQTQDRLRISSRRISEPLFIRVQPTGVGRIYLDIQCKINGIPFDSRLPISAGNELPGGEGGVRAPPVALILGRFDSTSPPTSVVAVDEIRRSLSERGPLPVQLSFDDTLAAETASLISGLVRRIEVVLQGTSEAESFATDLSFMLPDSGSAPVRLIVTSRLSEYPISHELQQHPWILPTLHYAPGLQLTGKRVLWVDDVPRNNVQAIDALRDLGAEVLTSLSTSAAIDEIRQNAFDIIITDQARVEDGTMNERAGYDLFDRSRNAGVQTPVILSTAFADDGEARGRGFFGATRTQVGVVQLVLDATGALASGFPFAPEIGESVLKQLVEDGIPAELASQLMDEPASDEWQRWLRGDVGVKLYRRIVRIFGLITQSGYTQLILPRTDDTLVVADWIDPPKRTYRRASLDGLIRTSVIERTTIAVRDVRKDDRYYSYEPSTESELSMPILHSEQSGVLAIINCEWSSSTELSGQQIRWLEDLTRQMAHALQSLVLVVDQAGNGDFKTIGEAIQAIVNGGRISVRSGVYDESLLVDRPMIIVGEGQSARDVVVQPARGPALHFVADAGVISGLSLSGGDDAFGVDIEANLSLLDCDITSRGFACVAIHAGANPTLQRNRIHDGAEGGVFMFDQALGNLEDNEIDANAYSGVEIATRANPVVRDNRIHDNQQNGVHLWDAALGMIEDNDIYSNGWEQLSIERDANPTVTHNQIRDGKRSGVFIGHNGHGVLEDNWITANPYSGVDLRTGSDVVLRNNRITGNGHYGIWLEQGAGGLVSNNDLRNNQRGGFSPGVASETRLTTSDNIE